MNRERGERDEMIRVEQSYHQKDRFAPKTLALLAEVCRESACKSGGERRSDRMRSLSERFPGRLAWSFILAAVVCAVFWPVTRNDFAGYDDNEYVTRNPRVNTGVTR